MKLNKRILIFAIIVGLISVALVYFYINNMKEDLAAEQDIEYIEVIVAQSIIPAFTAIEEEMLVKKEFPSIAVHPDAILDVNELLGKQNATDIYAGEQILASRLVSETTVLGLAHRIPEGMRAITIPVSELTGVGGYIEAGDRIDILVYYTKDGTELTEDEIDETETETEEETEETETETEGTAPIQVNAENVFFEGDKFVFTQFQNVEVLEVGPNTSENSGSGVTSSLTILTSPDKAEVLLYTSMNGSLYYTLRNVEDEAEVVLDYFGNNNFHEWKKR